MNVQIAGTAIITVVASSLTTMSYKWYKNGVLIDGATTGILAISPVSTTNSGTYYVQISNSGGTVTSSNAVLTIYGPPTIVTQPQGAVTTPGRTVSFYVAGDTNNPPSSYQWSRAGTAITGATNPTLTLTNVQSPTSGGYTVQLANTFGSVTSQTASLVVTNPVVTLSLRSAGGMNSSGFSFAFSAPVGLTYVVEASGDFNTWTPIATNAITTTNVTFTDPVASAHSLRFYRTRFQ